MVTPLAGPISFTPTPYPAGTDAADGPKMGRDIGTTTDANFGKVNTQFTSDGSRLSALEARIPELPNADFTVSTWTLAASASSVLNTWNLRSYSYLDPWNIDAVNTSLVCLRAGRYQCTWTNRCNIAASTPPTTLITTVPAVAGAAVTTFSLAMVAATNLGYSWTWQINANANDKFELRWTNGSTIAQSIATGHLYMVRLSA